MDRSVEKFKQFVRKHPKLRYMVRSGEQTWQSLFEEWSMLGEDDPYWDDYLPTGDAEPPKEEKRSGSMAADGQEFIKTALNYVKKLNPDDISKYINNAQKVLSLVQMFNGGANKGNQAKPMNYRPRRQIDPLFRRYDDYDY